ncbi:hypothetical protein [Kitasatospora sp. NPDC056273]|uniref:hypothetical protein n=1 Tax=Kitasatospora sp. NPDC056273 TaxID=3345769 RepID=UPI0035DFE902
MPLSAADLAKLGDAPVTIQSTFFPNVFLRMDGNGVPVTMAGGGTVNCQYGIGPWEKFNARAQVDGSFSFESAAFPGIFLRMVTGSGVTSATGPGGTVNCQVKANGGENEKFYLDKAQ